MESITELSRQMSLLLKLILLILIYSEFFCVGQHSVTPLDCSAYGVNASNLKNALQSWESRLHSCFADNPYDITQIPVLDSYRSWDTSQIPIFYLSLPSSEVWTPRFIFLNADEVKYAELNARPTDRVHLDPGGGTYIVFTRVLEGKCEINLWNFPFDLQICDFGFLFDRFNSGGGPQNVLLSRNILTYRSTTIPNAEWDMISTTTEAKNKSLNAYEYNETGIVSQSPVEEKENFFVSFEVSIKLQRHWIYYLLNILIPVFVLSVLTFVPFALEENEPEKIATGIAVILGFMFIQGIVADLLPKSAKSPYLAIYIASVILLSALSVIANLICYAITLLHYKKPASPGPIMRFVVLKVLGLLLYPSEWVAAARRCYKRKKSNGRIIVPNNISMVQLSDSITTIGATGEIQAKPNSESGSVESNDKETSMIRKNYFIKMTEWNHLAHVLNRFFALLHLVGSITLFTVFLIPIMASQSIK